MEGYPVRVWLATRLDYNLPKLLHTDSVKIHMAEVFPSITNEAFYSISREAHLSLRHTLPIDLLDCCTILHSSATVTTLLYSIVDAPHVRLT